MAHKLDQTYWLTADRSRAVPDGDPAAAFLLGRAGKEIPTDDAKRYGLVGSKAVSPAEDKAVKGPAKKSDG